MSEIVKEIKQWWKAVSDEHHHKKVLERQKEAKLEAARRVQAMEFGGELFFASMAFLSSMPMTSPTSWEAS